MLVLSAMTVGSSVAAERLDFSAFNEGHITLDLRPPDLDDLYTPEQIERLLSRTFHEDADANMEEVQVEGERPGTSPVPATPDIPGGLVAVFWAVANPLQAWRILAPVPSDRSLASNAEVTTYFPPAAVPPRSVTESP
jgi:hypothetical protein